MGEVVSERLVGKLMREHGLKAHYVKPWIKTTRNSDGSKKLTNVLQRDFTPAKPNSVWCTDITYIWTKVGFVYLTSVMNLYSRKNIAWTLSLTLEADEVVQCVKMAQSKKHMDQAIIIHSDRGSQYVSKYYRQLTEKMKLSYSDKANPWDNAPIEAFNALNKREWINRFVPENYEEAYSLVFEYIEGFYNTERIHSFCDYLSPYEYEQLFVKTLSA